MIATYVNLCVDILVKKAYKHNNLNADYLTDWTDFFTSVLLFQQENNKLINHFRTYNYFLLQIITEDKV